MMESDRKNSTGKSAPPAESQDSGDGGKQFQTAAPSISLPKGGGAIRGMGEKFAANPVTGTGSMSVPIAVSPGRSGFGPQLSLSYDSGSGNGPFGLGWNLSLPAITRKTDKGLPQYDDAEESDVFILSGAEDLVPVYKKDAEGNWEFDEDGNHVIQEDPRDDFLVRQYRPRIEGLFARIERWTHQRTGEIHWRSITKDNITTFYGRTAESCIADPENHRHIFTWLICESRDDKGNVILYEYKNDNPIGADLSKPHEANRTNRIRRANTYLKRIKYGNKVSTLARPNWQDEGWMFEVVFDYDEGHYETLPLPEDGRQLVRATIDDGPTWPVRSDPFSSYRSGFEVRTYRLCQRVLMFHHFAAELGAADYLVRSTEFDYEPTPIASYLNKVTQSGYVRQPDNIYLKRSLPPVEFEYSQAILRDEIRAVDAGSLDNLPIGLDGSNYQWIDLDGDGIGGILTEQGDAWFYKRNLSPLTMRRGSPRENGGDRERVIFDARFAPLETVAVQPSFKGITSGGMQFLDLAGNGRPDLVQFDGVAPGFFEHTEDNVWETHRPFKSLPNVNWRDPNLKFVDLTGDGHADILITEDEVFTWYPSLAEDGFGASERVRYAFDEERGPRVVFADGTQAISLADMSGDGLTDIVRVRNGEICYWPNLGYGRFGAKVTMDNSPWFDHPDQFDQRRIRLADIDGSGVTDIIYLHGDGIRLYFNQSGNSWGEAKHLNVFPQTDNLSSVAVVDLLGNGTACLIWSSPLPGHARRPMFYVDLMGGQKPHLMILSKNNLGVETEVQYAPSTKFYLQDKYDGKPWITRLPFPVHVVERVITDDRISRNRFVTRYKYHHGYFDGVEREFRGFGMVEQQDTEEFAALSESGDLSESTNLDATSHVPPVITRTWFHTGVYLGRDHISNFFAGLLDERDTGEYYREPGLTDPHLPDPQAHRLLLPDTELPDGLTIEEEREACRALKGSMLRQEVYALDGTGTEEYPYGHPYTVTEQNFTIRRLQPHGDNRHGVFFTHAREALSYHYEREPADPRIGQTLTLEVDDFGNVLKSAAIAYGRRQQIRIVDDRQIVTEAPNPGLNALELADRAKQTQIQITYTENRVTRDHDTGAAAIDAADDYRTPLPSESRTYELTGLTLPADRSRFAFDEILTAGATARALDYEEAPTAELIEKRLVEHLRTYYRRNDLTGPLPLGALQSLALPFQSYKLAFTPGLVNGVYGDRASDTMLETEGGYVRTEGDANWWIHSGRVFYSPDPDDTPPEELAYARRHFFLPHRFRDPFHTDAVSTESFVTYDQYKLLVQETRDALGNRVTIGERHLDPTRPPVRFGQDYRVLQPALVMDPNRNCSEVAFDALGMVVGTAVMGKPEEDPRPGDRLTAAFRADLTQSEIDLFLADPKGPMAATLLADATTRIVYDLTAWWREPDPARKPPAVAATLARETHASEPVPAGGLKIQVSLSYSDGFGREMQKKIQAEPGPVPTRDANGQIIVGPDGQPRMTPRDVNPRWVGSGWTVFNNKGKPVRQYEPFFTDTHRFEFEVKIGVSPVLFYDPVERVVATLHPNHTWEKVVFDPWQQATYDVNDTVLSDPRTDEDISGYVADYFATQPDWLTWYERREDSDLGVAELQAAVKAAAHAGTPTVAHFDSLGRPFLTIADNGNNGKYATRVVLDIEGNQRAVIDAKDRIVMHYDYDMLGNRVHQASMEAGERWMLNDVAGKSLYAWDSMGHTFRTTYDRLRRPIESHLREGASAEIVVGRSIYGESRSNPEASNLRGKVVELRDQAGIVTSDLYDFKGNLLRSQRQLAEFVDSAGTLTPAYKTTVNWDGVVQMQTETYTSRTRYDALNRPTQLLAPRSNQPGAKRNVIQPGYNEANLLERVDVWLDHPTDPAGLIDAATAPPAPVGVSDINYDAKGQRRLIDYGNGVRTTYTYDPLTFRLTHLYTRRGVAFTGDCDNPHPPPPTIAAPDEPPQGKACGLQNLHYTYDPAGNITYIRDDAQQTIYFNNQVVEPHAEYTYDAVYRLIEATGREHLGQAGGAPIPHSHNDAPRVGILWSANDGRAMGRYLERYLYDAVGNFLSMQHFGSDPANPSWTRGYEYNEASLIEPAKQSNRLTSTIIGETPDTYSRNGDGYDAHGNMLHMPHLSLMQWDYRDQLQATARQVVNTGTPETTWYVYDASGQRVRKVTESMAAGRTPTRMKERIYLGGFEIYREYENGGDTVRLERETLHIMDDKQRIALVETRIQGNDPAPQQLIRYQFGNHLGSASLELDDQAQIISYEEYTPYGSTSYQAVRSQTETPKRYRYTGKERDEETGFSYHSARYYAPWISRWCSADPSGIKFSINVYSYADTNPIKFYDLSGENPALALPLLGGAAATGGGGGAVAGGGAALLSNPIGWAILGGMVLGVVGVVVYRSLTSNPRPETLPLSGDTTSPPPTVPSDFWEPPAPPTTVPEPTAPPTTAPEPTAPPPRPDTQLRPRPPVAGPRPEPRDRREPRPRLDPRPRPDDDLPPPIPLPEPSDETGPRNRVFLDNGALIALAQRRPDIIALIGNRQIITSTTAFGEFTRSRRDYAGPSELAGAFLVEEALAIVPDTPSRRVAGLHETGGIGAADKRIFGTADELGLHIITGDERFINSAREQGVELDHRLIPSATFTGR